MKVLLIALMQLWTFGIICAQAKTFDEELFEKYNLFKESSIVDQRFKHSDIQPLIHKLKANNQFSVKKVGQSIEGRDISLISIGTGKTQVLLWSQMHGNEPTATMSLMDIFNFFSETTEFAEVKDLLKNELTIHFMPMLNPDGAEVFERRNAINIDLNRDALRLQSSESRILKDVRDSLNADWGFNLHDQNRYYGAGNNEYSASISFLAPAYNYEKEINKGRGNAMKLISEMNGVLQKHIPNKVGRYSDEFEPRAFGDNIQKWGTNTILIESGSIFGDNEKQALRKLNFVAIVSAFKSIADGSYEQRKVEEYDEIPFNKSNLFSDLIIRRANLPFQNKNYVVDISFVRNEINYNNSKDYYFRSSISDVGDLSIFYAHEEFDASEYTVKVGKTYSVQMASKANLLNLDVIDLLRKGFTNIIIQTLPKVWLTDEIPISFLSGKQKPQVDIAPGFNPSLLLSKDGSVRKVIVNGFLYDLEDDKVRILENWKSILKQIN